MRMRPAFPVRPGIALCIALFGGLTLSGVLAAPSVNPAPPSSTPSRAPIGAPPAENSEEINGAYAFRNKMSSDPACQEIARQTDAIYSDPKLDADQKKQALDQLRGRAQSASCF